MAWKLFHRLDTVGEPQIFRNYSPLLMWVLAPVWVTAIGRVAYTVNLAHTISIFRLSLTGGLFLASCAMAVACLRKPLLTIPVGPDGAAVRETWLWRSRESYMQRLN